MLRLNLFVGAACIAFGSIAAPTFAQPPQAPGTTAPVQDTAFEQDRTDILAMAGNYKVRFDMQESTRWDKSYTPLEPKVSGGYESVRVLEDTGRKIVLQHLLVVTHDGKDMVIKHWRQDWEYEPERVLVYADRHTWKWEDVSQAMRKGRWSQTVWQVDDSPRYGGWGQFDTNSGVRRWRSNWTWRPLARRDATRNPVYDRYLGINRHQNGPDGWIHWQDNTKLVMKDGKQVPIVQEYVLNTYTKFDGYNVKAADDYMNATAEYWAAIRKEWTRVAEANKGIGIQEDASSGTVISGRLMQLAEDIREGKIKTAAAIKQGRKLIADNVKPL